MRVEDWSDKQFKVLEDIMSDDYRVVVIPGPVRSGKTLSAVYNFHWWAFSNFRNSDFILATNSNKQMQNVLVKYSQMFSDSVRGGWRKTAGGYVMKSRYGGFNRFIDTLGGRADSWVRLQGLTAQGALLDEATTLDETFIDVVEDRLSLPGSKLVLVCNPSGPLHYIKRNYVDAAEEDESVSHIPFELADNPTLNSYYLERLKNRYSGAMYDRMVLGKWAIAEGMIYPSVMERVARPPDGGAAQYTVGVDYGPRESTHAVMVARMMDGRDWVVDEWEWNQNERFSKSDTQMADEMAAWAHPRTVDQWTVDSSAESMIAALSFVVRGRVVAADNSAGSVYRGIQVIRHELDNGMLWISNKLGKCEKLIKQMSNYEWDPKGKILSEERPLKVDDHGCDALRYDRDRAITPRVSVEVRR